MILAHEVYDNCSPSYCTDKPSSINDFALVIPNPHKTPKTLNNNIGNQLAADNNQAATADQDAHYKRQQSTSWLDNRLQELLSTETTSEALEPV